MSTVISKSKKSASSALSTQKAAASKSAPKKPTALKKPIALKKPVAKKQLPLKASSKKNATKPLATKPLATKKPSLKKAVVKKAVVKKVAPPKQTSKKALASKSKKIVKTILSKNTLAAKKIVKKEINPKSSVKKNATLKPQAADPKLVAKKILPIKTEKARPPLQNNKIKGEQKNMKAAVTERQTDVTRKVGTAVIRLDKIDRREIKELDLSNIAEAVPTEVVDPGFLTKDDVFDEADHAQWQQLREQASIHARAINLNKPEKHPDFDGEHCIDCDEKIPEARLFLSKVRCVDCQNDLEQKKKIINSRSHMPSRSSDFDFD